MTATAEFWRTLEPTTTVFRLDTLLKIHTPEMAEADERSFGSSTKAVSSRSLRISPSQNGWCGVLMAKRPGSVDRRCHPHHVFAHAISGG